MLINNLTDLYTEKIIDVYIKFSELLEQPQISDELKKTAENLIRWGKKYLSSVFNISPEEINVTLLKKYRDNPIYKKIGYSPFVAPSLKKFWEEIFLSLDNLAKKKNTPVTLKDLPIEDYKKSLKILEEAIKTGELLPIEPMRRQYEFLPKFMSLFLSSKTLHITDFDPTHIIQVQALLQMEDFYKSQVQEKDDQFELKHFKLIFNELLTKGRIESNIANEDFAVELGRNIYRTLRSNDFNAFVFTIYTPSTKKHLQRIFIHEGLLKKCHENNGNFSLHPADMTDFIAHLVNGRALFDVSDKGEMLIDSHREIQKEKPSFSSAKSAFIDHEGNQITLTKKDGIYYAQKTAKEPDDGDAIVLAMTRTLEDGVIILGPDNQYKLTRDNSVTPAILTFKDDQLAIQIEESASDELNELLTKDGLRPTYIGGNAKGELINKYQIAGNTIKLSKKEDCFYATPRDSETINENNRIVEGNSRSALKLYYDEKINKYKIIIDSVSKEATKLELNANGILKVSYSSNADLFLNLFVTRSGKFIFPENRARVFHSSPVSGACLQAPLQIQAQEGLLASIDNHSGHYRPWYLVIYTLIGMFEKYNLNLSRLVIPVRSRKKILSIYNQILEINPRIQIDDIARKHIKDGYYPLTVVQFKTLMEFINHDAVKNIPLIKNFISNLTKEQSNIVDNLLKLISEFVYIDRNPLQPLDPKQKKAAIESVKKQINDLIEKVNTDNDDGFFHKNTIHFFDLFNSEPSDLEEYYDLIEILMEAAANRSNPLLFCYYKFLDLYNEAKKLFSLKSELPFIFTVDSEHYQNIITELEKNIATLNGNESTIKHSAEKILRAMQVYYWANPFFFEKRDAKLAKLVISLHWACFDYLVVNDAFFNNALEKLGNVSNLLTFLQQKPLTTAIILPRLEEFWFTRSSLPRLKFLNSEKSTNGGEHEIAKPLITFINKSLIKAFELKINEEDPIKCFNLIQQQLNPSSQVKSNGANVELDVELEDCSINRTSL